MHPEQAVDNCVLHEQEIRASFGTTKYCTYFLREASCPNPECLYLHQTAKKSDCYDKNEIIGNKILFYEKNIAMDHILQYKNDIARMKPRNSSIFPSIIVVLERIKKYERLALEKQSKNPSKPSQ